MIRRHNRTQWMYAVLLFCGSVGLSAMIYWIVDSYFMSAVRSSRLGVTEQGASGIPLAAVGICFLFGYYQWRKQGGVEGYRESLRQRYWRESTIDDDVTDVFSVTWFLDDVLVVQVMRSAPRWLFMAYARLTFRLPNDPALNASLEQTFAKIKAAGRWQGPEDYPGKLKEILDLVEMGLLDYSDFNGRRRFKVR